MPSSASVHNNKKKKVKFSGVSRVRMIEPSGRVSGTQIYLATKKFDGATSARVRRSSPSTKARRKPHSPNTPFVNDRWAANLSTGNIARLPRGNDRGVPLTIAMKFLNHYFPPKQNNVRKNAKPSSRS